MQQFVYSDVLELEKTSKVGTKQCVALIQHFTAAGHHSAWKKGDSVLGNKTILPGTAIATFVNGSYPHASTGNHAAFFLRHDVDGFWVMDQWASDNQKPRVSSRLIRKKSKTQNPNGSWPEGGNNAYAYSIIER